MTLDNLKTQKKIFSTSVIVFLVLISVFTRSLLGVTIFSFRLGELVVGIGFTISIYFLIFAKPKKYFHLQGSKFHIIHKFIIFYFLIRMVINYDSITLYYFKSSSYIWTIAFIYFGIFIARISNTYSISSLLFFVSPILIFVFQTGNYPNIVIEFFLKYSDKFQFMKASDMVLAVIISSTYFKFVYKNNNFYIYWALFLVSLFLPLVAANSRGAVGGLLLFLILFLIINFKKLFDLKYKNLILLLIILSTFSYASLRVSGVTFDTPDKEINSGVVNEIPDAVRKIAKEKSTEDVFLSFYINNNRLFSTDPTTNWRLDIWQDVYEDLSLKNRLIRGYGYSEIIPVMKDPSAPGRLGRDGLNEHVHNYFVTTFARGGYINLLLFILLHFSLIKFMYKSNMKSDSLLYAVPCLFMSSVDITMDGVQFPLIYYFFIGYFLYQHSSDIR